MCNYTEDLRGKKLLLLGGHALMTHVVNKAHELGVYVIVTDYNEAAPAKKIADEAYEISTLDEERLISLCNEKKVDGVFTGYSDVNLAPCSRICRKLGIPFYATEEQLESTMNKVNFKNLCRKHGILVPDDVNISALDKIKYPIIVKPADSYSSKGISVCNRKEEVDEAIKKALDISDCKKYVAEEYIYGDDIYLYFTVQNGIVSLSAMADRLLNNEQYGCAPQPVGYFFPSKYINLYNEKIKYKVQSMITDIGLENGSFFLQGFVKDENVILFEMGLRLSGGAGYLQIRHQNEIDQVEMHIRYALTGIFGPWDITKYDNPRFSKPACVLVILLKDGVIKNIEGLEDVKKNEMIFDIVQFKNIGDRLNAKGTLNQVFARIYLCGGNKTELKETVKFVKTTLKIFDEQDNNMILHLFDENIFD